MGDRGDGRRAERPVRRSDLETTSIRRPPTSPGSGENRSRGVGVGWGAAAGDGVDTHVTAVSLLERYGFPDDPDLRRRADQWVTALPELAGLDVLALFQYEMRFGCWGGMLTCATPDAYSFVAYPYANRAVLDAALRLPLEYRCNATSRMTSFAADRRSCRPSGLIRRLDQSPRAERCVKRCAPFWDK